MKLSCIDQSVTDGDCYLLSVANVSALYLKLIEGRPDGVINALEQPLKISSRLLRFRRWLKQDLFRSVPKNLKKAQAGGETRWIRESTQTRKRNLRVILNRKFFVDISDCRRSYARLMLRRWRTLKIAHDRNCGWRPRLLDLLQKDRWRAFHRRLRNEVWSKAFQLFGSERHPDSFRVNFLGALWGPLSLNAPLV
jgi:hypothetical protein